MSVTLISFLADLAIGSDSFIGSIITRFICFLGVLWFLNVEIRQMLRLKEEFREYLTDYWNMNDLLFLTSYLIYIPCSFLVEPELYFSKVLLCFVVISAFIKLTSYLIIFEDFGFLVQMVVFAIRDSFYFIMCFLIIISSFAVEMSFLTTGIESNGLG